MPVRPGPIRTFSYTALLSLLALLAFAPLAPVGRAAPASGEEWISNRSYRIDLLGRDGPNGTDHYRVTLDWGATFFGIAVETMPLVPPEKAVSLLMDGYRGTFPGRPVEDIQPGDVFDFYVPPGTLVCTRWRQRGNAMEYQSLRGDNLVVYIDPLHPIKYRLARVEDPTRQEVMVNHEVDLEPDELAKSIFGRDDPEFKPDYLQIQRAKDIIANRTTTVLINTARTHIDDFLEIKGSGKAGGETEDGLQIYWFSSGETAQSIFRVDDGIRDQTDPKAFPSPSRVYYYKDGVVRTYQRVDDVALLSGRQPNSEAWAKVYAEWGQLAPPPTRWELGQPEQDVQAEELNKLGIAVLRFQPKQPPRGNFLTQLLETLLSMMKRKES